MRALGEKRPRTAHCLAAARLPQCGLRAYGTAIAPTVGFLVRVARVGWLPYPPNRGLFGEPELRIRAVDEAVPMLGAVLS